MSVLDELREAIDAHVGAASGDRKHTWMDAIRLLDAFEAAHPKIVDLETVTTADMYRLGYSVRMCANEDTDTKAAP